MADLNDIFQNLKKLDFDIRKITFVNNPDDLDELKINYNDSQELFLRDQIHSILNQLAAVHNKITYLSAPTQEVGRLHLNASGHYETSGYEFHCGNNLEALVEDDWHDVPYWVQTRVEASEGQYYLVGYRDVPLDGLQVRIRKSF